MPLGYSVNLSKVCYKYHDENQLLNFAANEMVLTPHSMFGIKISGNVTKNEKLNLINSTIRESQIPGMTIETITNTKILVSTRDVSQ